jgi:putative flippase GtrA
VTCPSLLRCRPAAAEFVGDLSRGSLKRVRDVSTALAARLRRDDTFAQFARFVLVGGASTAVYAVLFVPSKGFGALPAHVVATVVSSVLANEMHRRLTFRADERVGWLAAQVEAGGVSLFGLVATSAALAGLDAAAETAQPLLQITVVTTVTGIIGLIRFVALRWIFRPTEAAPAR